ncbi:DUF3288 family protein [Prochlorococcus sp. MIT 1223]|uniref:DUF3288 family protein n=1 Tax=Prochlorococcus sp. MIT 1223 TaxID=3096217 RepID=UPI002A753AEC|nr:DUF3288 family protein [Prochlorococcus sp. MIT 1223]
MNKEQNHPLYKVDRDNLNRLLAKKLPDQADLVDLGRLLIRYNDFPGAEDIQSDMKRILSLWGLTKGSLESKTKKIWEDGFRPGKNPTEIVGSGFDTSDNVIP